MLKTDTAAIVKGFSPWYTNKTITHSQPIPCGTLIHKPTNKGNTTRSKKPSKNTIFM